jgi:hypothetical protein
MDRKWQLIQHHTRGETMNCGNCEYLCKDGYAKHPPRCDKYFPAYRGDIAEIRNKGKTMINNGCLIFNRWNDGCGGEPDVAIPLSRIIEIEEVHEQDDQLADSTCNCSP